MVKPGNILEIGTYTGYSAICLAKGLKPGGKLITIEVNDELTSFSHSYFCKAGLDDRITQLTGSALDIIPGLDIMFDLVFIDGDKKEYSEYYRLIIDKVKPGGFILADNVLWSGKVVEKEDSKDVDTAALKKFNRFVQEDERVENTLLPVRDGLMLIRKK